MYPLAGIELQKFCSSLLYMVLQLICGQWVLLWLNSSHSVLFFLVHVKRMSFTKFAVSLGLPTQNSWSEGLNLANVLKYQFPQFARVHLSMLIPSASDDAISLISSLCSWDPHKRPTAAEALQHPFFQSCFYVQPSLRPRAPKTPPPVEMKGSLAHQSARSLTKTLSNNPKSASNFLSPNVISHFKTGVQRKLETIYEDGKKNEKYVQINLKQPPYRPPAMNNYPAPEYRRKSASKTWDVASDKFTRSIRGNSDKVSNVTDKITQLKVSSATRNISRPTPPTWRCILQK